MIWTHPTFPDSASRVCKRPIENILDGRLGSGRRREADICGVPANSLRNIDRNTQRCNGTQGHGQILKCPGEVRAVIGHVRVDEISTTEDYLAGG